MDRYIFPRWSNRILPMVFFFVLGPAATAAVAGLWYYGTNKHIEVGFEPVQPVEYSHRLHANELGMDCRYCHYTAERSAFAAVPPTETCMNCHWKVRTDSLLLLPVRESYASDKPIEWVRVHNLPDYAYFNHSAHLAAGVACQSCHGRIDAMIRVQQAQPLSMGWCLECHRDPAPHLREPNDVTKMLDKWPNLDKSGHKAVAANGRELHPPTWCSGCHR